MNALTLTFAIMVLAAAQVSAPAQGRLKPGAQSDLIIYVGILLLILLGGAVLIFTLRSKLFAKEEAEDANMSIMESLRAMYKRGEISEEEYEATRKSMKAKLSAKVSNPQPDSPLPRRGGKSPL